MQSYFLSYNEFSSFSAIYLDNFQFSSPFSF
jgi:hypothetical protein